MRRQVQVTGRKTLVTMAAAGGLLALAGGYAHADSGAASRAAHSPGLLSGNAFQAPVDAPLNACGNTVTVVGALNPAFGNHCANLPARPGHPQHPEHPGHPHEPCDEDTGPGHPQHPGGPGGHGNPGGPGDNGNPGGPGDHGNPGGPGDNANPGGPGGNGNPGGPGGNGTPGGPGDHGNPGGPGGNGNPGGPGGGQQPGTPTGPGSGPGTGSVTPVTHPAKGVGDSTASTPARGLAATGSGDVLTAGLPLAAGMLLAGAVLYRRARSAA
ncbi:chaplin [Streptomyces sp. NPDC056773]|uniref:chaplin n=1 Tax=unclassified Streptomyces TaxID=2593676 RepID=UPI00367F0269